MAVVGGELLIGRPGGAARTDAPTGGVHVFRRQAAGRWSETALLTSKPSAAREDFGAALAVDGAWLAVGAPLADGERGAVYLFQRLPAGRWVERAKLAVRASGPGDHFGTVVALRDGVVLAGAPEYAHERGAVAVFRRGASGGRWTEQATLTSTDSSARGFGRALALTPGRAIVGAPGPATIKGPGVPPATPTAQVLVFRDSVGLWIPETRLTNPDTLPWQGSPSQGRSSQRRSSRASRFGAALLSEGAELWVSAPMAGDGGAVFRFQYDSIGHWKAVGRLVASTAAAIAAPDQAGIVQFGTALAQAGHDRLIGASSSSRPVFFVFRYDSASATWMETQRLPPSASSDPTSTFPNIERVPTWFTDPFVLAAGEDAITGKGIAVVGLVWVDVFEGAGLVLERDGQQSTWRSRGTIVDSAWTTRVPLVGRLRPCNDGTVQGVFACSHVDLLAFLPRRALGAASDEIISDLWGWSDAVTGREFALVGRTDGTSIVEVTNPLHPAYLGELPRHQTAEPSHLRDIKIYRDHAFIVSDGAGRHGVQVFDLAQLRTIKAATVPVTFVETAYYDGIASAHNIVADTATGFIYAVGSNGGGETCGGGLHMIDVHDPLHPTFAGCYAEPRTGRAGTGYIHDAECVRYHGPDTKYQGRELCFNAAETAVSIADVTDKKQPRTLSLATYPNVGYTHQAWLSEDQRYLFVDDEFDEYASVLQPSVTGVLQTRTMVFDLSDLDDPVLAAEIHAKTTATDHNQYVRGRYLYQSNYTAGLRVLDVVDPRHPREVGTFDTAPAFSDSPGPGQPRMSEGSWSNYPYFRSGAIAVTSMSEGLFLVRYRPGAR